jgi:predicted enzyme related to lactoylglutathione lyase
MSEVKGKFVWHDEMTNDIEGAQAFYGNVVGWNIADAGMGDRTYKILSAGEAGMGGLMPMPDEARETGASAVWFGYLGVSDVDAFAKRVEKAGGSVHRQPADIPGVGRFAVVSDPQGATFILFTPKDPPERPVFPRNGTGHVGWCELYADDLDSAWDSYSNMFGWSKDMAVDMGEMGTYQTFAAGGGTAVGGIMRKTPEMQRPFWHYYFNVDAIDAAAGRVKANGGEVIAGPHEVPSGEWMIHCKDPQGARFGLLASAR